jgi:hypothetical protein
MDLLLSLLALLCTLVGIVGCIVPALPGVILSFVGVLCAWGASWSELSVATVCIWLAVTVAVTVADYFLPGWMARRFGGSRAGSLGATIGIFVGLFFGPWGILLGPFAGAIIGELLHDSTDKGRAFKVGIGSFLAFAVGTGIKLTAAIAMFVLVIADTWGPFKAWVTAIF